MKALTLKNITVQFILPIQNITVTLSSKDSRKRNRVFWTSKHM